MQISFHLCDTQLVEGEISLHMLPLHDFESVVKMFTFPLLTLHKITSNINLYSGKRILNIKADTLR